MENVMKKAKPFRIKGSVGYLFMLPFLILFFLFTLLPVLISFFYSFTDYSMLQPAKFIGLANFKSLIMDDDVFLIALKNTFLFAVITGPITFIASFLMAWLINSLKVIRIRNVISLAFYAPSITSGVALSVVWLYFFSSDRYGLINNLLIQINIIAEPIKWTLDAKTILPVVMIVSIWMGMGTGFLTFLAGLQNLSAELFEAGMIDGVKNKFQELIYITLPQLKPQLLFGAINASVAAFSVFDIAVAIAGFPSPNYAAHTIVAHLYDYAFIRFQMGYASAIAIILFFITFLLGKLFMKIFASNDI